MKEFYHFGKKFYGVWEIESDMPYADISEDKNLHLLNLPFRICHGKKQRDIIYYYGDISIEFLSHNIYTFLSQYGDVSPYLYPIHINNVEDVYYFVHDLPEVECINPNVKIPGTICEFEIPCFLLQDDQPPLFTMSESRLKIITPEMKAAMIKAKLTNIAFEPIYGVSSMKEYYELQRNGDLQYTENHRDRTNDTLGQITCP
ncbi:MAG: hypothetical protein IJP45_08270 [Paludibacteraceae bacterium]|nr:hypothetical protein [Paludibacteraceae bacterium]MBQ7672713.1 hypothetical protein [Paludibacteraceae bacterium]